MQDPKSITELAAYRAIDLEDTVFGGSVHLREMGPAAAPPVLLVHGIGENGARDFFPIAPQLAARFHVFAVDLPGFGYSTHAAGALYSPDNYVRVLHDVVRPHIEGAFTLVGHSMGAAVSLEYAHKYPADVGKLALIDAAGILHRSALVPLIAQTGIGAHFEPAQGIVGTLTGIVVDRAGGPEPILDSDFARSHVLSSPNQIAAAALIVHNFGAAVAESKTETLVIWGRNDPIAPLRTARLLGSRLEHARLAILENSGHVPMETEPGALAHLLLEFLEAPPTSAATSTALASSKPSTHLQSRRFGRCENTAAMQFEGDYQHIDIVGCNAARVQNVRAESITVRSSRVTIEATRLESPELALDVIDSQLEITGSVIIANVAVRVSRSELDVAGTEFNGRFWAIEAATASRILFSASSITSPLQRRYVHDLLDFGPRQIM